MVAMSYPPDTVPFMSSRSGRPVIAVVFVLALLAGFGRCMAGPETGGGSVGGSSGPAVPPTSVGSAPPGPTSGPAAPGGAAEPDGVDAGSPQADAPSPGLPSPPPPPPAGSPADQLVAQARQVFGDLPVRGRAPKTGYSRAEFGSAWTDDVSVEFGHNGCDTRNDILRRDLSEVVVKPGTRDCVVLSGVLIGPYSGQRIDFVRGRRSSSEVQIDHVVALSDAWQKGAQQLPPDRRVDLANDPLNLLAVSGSENQSKSDGDAATWLPPLRDSWCGYVSRQVLVKHRYQLWVTEAEHAAIDRILSGCG